MQANTPNVKLSVKYSNHKTLPFLDCNVTINQDNLFTSIFRKKNKNIHWPWALITTAL